MDRQAHTALPECRQAFGQDTTEQQYDKEQTRQYRRKTKHTKGFSLRWRRAREL
ncbi:hypothetical protein MOW08_09845 [Acinetobacter schindleri]|nr:hypothetical protein MOW08_09845 [Acinetobacter schindleri]